MLFSPSGAEDIASWTIPARMIDFSTGGHRPSAIPAVRS